MVSLICHARGLPDLLSCWRLMERGGRSGPTDGWTTRSPCSRRRARSETQSRPERRVGGTRPRCRSALVSDGLGPSFWRDFLRQLT